MPPVLDTPPAIVWAKFRKKISLDTAKPDTALEKITTFAEVLALNVYTQYKALIQTDYFQPPDFFRPYCANCKANDHYEIECLRNYPPCPYKDLLVRSAEIMAYAMDPGYVVYGNNRTPFGCPSYCYFCKTPSHGDPECQKRLEWEANVRKRNKVNPTKESLEAEGNFHLPYNVQHRHTASPDEKDSLKEMWKRPENTANDTQAEDGWQTVPGPKVCKFCLRQGHDMEHCRAKRIEDNMKNIMEQQKQEASKKFAAEVKNAQCSACERFGHSDKTCWYAHPELRSQQPTPFSGFNNRKIVFFDLEKQNWEHYMSSNPLKATFIHFWLTNQEGAANIHPGGEYSYTENGKHGIDNEVWLVKEALHARQVTRVEKPWDLNDLLKKTNDICTFCTKAGHSEDNCYEQYPILKPNDSWRNPNIDQFSRELGVKCLKCSRVHSEEKGCPIASLAVLEEVEAAFKAERRLRGVSILDDDRSELNQRDSRSC